MSATFQPGEWVIEDDSRAAWGGVVRDPAYTPTGRLRLYIVGYFGGSPGWHPYVRPLARALNRTPFRRMTPAELAQAAAEAVSS